MSHTVSIQGQVVNHWTIDDPKECGPVGGGSLTVSFRSTQTRRVLPVIDPFQRGVGRRYGAWTMWVPYGHGLLRHMPALRSSATLTLVDNTARRPREGTPCPAADKSGCGTRPLRRARSGIGQYDRRRITVTMSSELFEPAGGECGTGSLDYWSRFAIAGGSRPDGDVIVRMPRASALKRRRVVRVTGTSHKRTTFRDALSDNPETVTNDVTRKVTVTFRRL